MDLTESQFQSLVETVAERVRASIVPASQPAMVQLPPEFYQSQRELGEQVARLEARFDSFETRFEEYMRHVDQRFEAVDKRFEQIDKRFEQIDKRFEQIDKRFDDLIHYVDKRFSVQQWMIGVGFLVITTLMTVYQFLA